MRNQLFEILFRHRGELLLLLTVPVVSAALRGGGIDRETALLGTSIAAAGVLLRLAAVRRIGRSARTQRIHARAGLIAAGPYRWTRNPLYLAAALMLCGFGLLAGAGWLAVALIPATLLAYTPVVLAEERALTGLFGDAYRRYAACVPRWIGVSRTHPVDQDRKLVRWSEVFHREKWLVPGSLAAALAISALRSERVPLARVARGVAKAVDLDLGELLGLAALLIILAHAIHVEIQRRRRREPLRVSTWQWLRSYVRGAPPE